MSKRKGKPKSSDEQIRDSQIYYTFDENSENPFVPRPRVNERAILTRARARNTNISTVEDNSDSPFISVHRISRSPLVSQVIESNLPSSLQPAESAVNMGNDNETNSLPRGSQQMPSGGSNLNDLNILTSRLERVLTLNHNTFMGELTNLRQSLLENFNRNSVSYNQPLVNPVNTGINRNNANSSFHNQSINSDSDRSTSSNDSVRMHKWNITYDGTDDVNDFLFKVDTLKARYNCSHHYISSNFHILLKGKANT